MDKEWALKLIDKLAEFGKTDRGINRQAFSKADVQVKQYIIKLMQDIGMTVRQDEIGNVIGRLEGMNSQLPAVATGSHLDTVPEGGKYDGVVGVVGGLIAMKRLKERNLTHPLELIVFTAEESSRFAYATMGSKAMTGRMNRKAWEKATDCDDISFPQALREQGLSFETIGNCVRNNQDIKAFIELHIEQGPVLEQEGQSIGIVEAIAAPTRLKITVQGVAGHSGTTPMEDRHDALVSAAAIILAIQEVALEQSRYGTVGTVGMLKVHPGAMNVIPGVVELWVDIRGVNQESIIECLQDIKDAVSTIAEGQETSMAIEMLSADKPVPMDQEITRAIEKVCRKAGIAYKRMNSGAGHDAMNMAYLAPTGMIFIPCHNGVSHNPDEYANPEDIAAGIDVLTETLYELAK